MRKQQVLVRRGAAASMQHPACPTFTCRLPSQPPPLPSFPRPLVSQDLRPADNRRSVLLQLQELTQRHGGTLPQLDPVEDMGVTDDVLVEAAKKLQGVEALLQQNPGRRVWRRQGLGAGRQRHSPLTHFPFNTLSTLFHTFSHFCSVPGGEGGRQVRGVCSARGVAGRGRQAAAGDPAQPAQRV